MVDRFESQCKYAIGMSRFSSNRMGRIHLDSLFQLRAYKIKYTLKVMADWRTLIFMLFAMSQTVNTLVIIASTVNAIFVHYFPTHFFTCSFETISFLNVCIFHGGAMHGTEASSVYILATWQSISILFVWNCCFIFEILCSRRWSHA